MPVDSNGYTARTLSEILAESQVELALVQDPDSGEFLQPDFESDDPIMQVAKVPLEGVAFAESNTKNIYDQFNPNNATGTVLSGEVLLNGIERNDESGSTIPITYTGTPNATIAPPIVVSDELENNTWRITEEVTLDVAGNATVTATCEQFGAILADPATVTKIITPATGLDSVTNGTQLSTGRLEESDPDLRARQAISTAAPGASVIESLFANLLDVDGVNFARAYQNLHPTNVDTRGIDPATLACVVVGGDDAEIAQTIFTRYGAVQTQGDTTVEFFDAQGESYPISFQRPAQTPIFVEVDIEVYNGSVFPDDGAEQITQAIIAYAEGGAKALGIEDGFEDGFLPGVDIEWSRLFTPVNSIPGHRVTRLEIGLSAGALSESPIPIDFDAIGAFITGNITVTIV